MTVLFVIRDKIKAIYGKTSMVIMPIIRFLVAYIAFNYINGQIGYDTRLLQLPVVVVLAAISALLPSYVTVLIAAVMTVLHIFAAAPLLSLIFLLLLAVLYFFMARFASRYALVVLFMPILAHYNLLPLAPLVLGLIASPTAVFAVIPGVMLITIARAIKDAILMSTSSMALQDLLPLYVYIVKQLTSDRDMMLMIIVSVCVLLATWAIRRIRMPHVILISVLTGMVMNIALSIVGNTVMGLTWDTRTVVIGTIISGIIALVIQFFRYLLDYSTVEHVQFEDDDYYYYVTAVPKLKVTSPEKSVVKITEAPEEEEEPEDEKDQPDPALVEAIAAAEEEAAADAEELTAAEQYVNEKELEARYLAGEEIETEESDGSH